MHHWPSVAEQVSEATRAIAEALSAAPHVDKPLYRFQDDCGHLSPEHNQKYDGVDDLIDDWMQRNCGMDSSWPEFIGSREVAGAEAYDRRQDHISLIGKNRDRAEKAIPLAAEWRLAQVWFDEYHTGEICLATPMGTYCAGCPDERDEDPDYGIEPSLCRRQEAARERSSDFWGLFTAESLVHMAQLHADSPFELADWIS